MTTANPDTRLSNIMLILQQDPAAYRGFGWLWWALKAMLKASYTPDDLSLLGTSNNPTAVRLAQRQYGSAERIINAAIDNYQYRAQRAQLYASDDHYPSGLPVRVTDPDAGYANTKTTTYTY